MIRHQNMTLALNALKALNHPVRLSILCHLIEKDEMAASELFENEKEYASQSQVSQYLKQLKELNYISSRKEGLFVFYKISSPEIKELIAKMHQLFCK